MAILIILSVGWGLKVSAYAVHCSSVASYEAATGNLQLVQMCYSYQLSKAML